MSEKKTDQAMRLFEALDGVDPALLERSGKEKKIIPFQRYVRIAAACLAMLVVGGMIYMVNSGGALHQKAAESAADNAAFSGSGNKAAGSAVEGIQKAEEACCTEEMSVRQDENYEGSLWNVAEEEVGAEDSTNTGIEAETDAAFEAAVDGISGMEPNSDNAKEQKGAATITENKGKVEGLLNYLGLRGKNSLDIQTEASQLISMKVVLGDREALVSDPDAEAKLYNCVNELFSRQMTKTEETGDVNWEIAVLAADESADGTQGKTDGFFLSGRYLKIAGDETVYQITDEDFDYNAFREELERIIGEEEN